MLLFFATQKNNSITTYGALLVSSKKKEEILRGGGEFTGVTVVTVCSNGQKKFAKVACCLHNYGKKHAI